MTPEYRPSNPGAKKGARVIKPKKASLIKRNKMVKVLTIRIYPDDPDALVETLGWIDCKD